MMIAKKYNKRMLKKLADELLKWYQQDENILMMDFFASKGLCSSDWQSFSKEDEYFKRVLIMASEIQETRLVMGGLNGKLNQSFASFVLKNVVGYKDLQDTEIKEEDEKIQNLKNLSDEELNIMAKEMAEKILRQR